jgi:hypothetical protein
MTTKKGAHKQGGPRNRGEENMTCSDYQQGLAEIIETGGSADQQQHLRECRVCTDLVNDLRYIAEVAKLLVPMEDPDPRVWDGIQHSLEREGLIKGKRSSGSGSSGNLRMKIVSRGL